MEGGPPVNSSERQQGTTEAEDNNTDQATVDSNSTLPISELVPPRSHVYYFIQRFDAEKQELNTIGTFFATKSETIKESIRTALGFEKNKQFLLWHRVDGISVVAISSVEIFDDIVGYTDGECFIVGDVIGKNERMKLAEAGLFSSPDRLVRYLWAVGRKHPTKSFTGTKTTEATYNGDYYSGEFKNGYYHGKGTHISESGATYTGDFVLGERQGTGTMEYATGDTYTGDWVEDQRHGQGTFVERKTGNKYVGGYRNGKRHGKGISYWEVADEEMDLCQICYSENQDSLFYSCGHVCACLSCARQVDICPMCRKKVLNVVKIYKS
nr:meichroacidin [Coccidioides posadasii RMSCC 3488]